MVGRELYVSHKVNHQNMFVYKINQAYTAQKKYNEYHTDGTPWTVTPSTSSVTMSPGFAGPFSSSNAESSTKYSSGFSRPLSVDRDVLTFSMVQPLASSRKRQLGFSIFNLISRLRTAMNSCCFAGFSRITFKKASSVLYPARKPPWSSTLGTTILQRWYYSYPGILHGIKPWGMLLVIQVLLLKSNQVTMIHSLHVGPMGFHVCLCPRATRDSKPAM